MSGLAQTSLSPPPHSRPSSCFRQASAVFRMVEYARCCFTSCVRPEDGLNLAPFPAGLLHALSKQRPGTSSLYTDWPFSCAASRCPFSTVQDTSAKSNTRHDSVNLPQTCP